MSLICFVSSFKTWICETDDIFVEYCFCLSRTKSSGSLTLTCWPSLSRICSCSATLPSHSASTTWMRIISARCSLVTQMLLQLSVAVGFVKKTRKTSFSTMSVTKYQKWRIRFLIYYPQLFLLGTKIVTLETEATKKTSASVSTLNSILITKL